MEREGIITCGTCGTLYTEKEFEKQNGWGVALVETTKTIQCHTLHPKFSYIPKLYNLIG